MAIPQLETCCCGCTLRTGTKIIGWISLISGILMLIMIGTGLAAMYYIEDHPEMKSKEADEIRAHLPALKALSIFLILVHILTCGLSFMLLLGAYQNKAKLVFYWVVISLTAVIIEQACNFISLLFLYQSNRLYSMAFSLLDLYFILVVYSFYREIKNVSTYP